MEPILPPAVIFFIGALLIPLFKGNIKKIFLLFIPLISILHMFSIEPYTGWTYVFLDFELIFIHADRLSLFMGYIFTIMALLVTIYNLNLKKDSDHMVSFFYIGCALGVVFAGDLFTFIMFWKMMLVTSILFILLKRDEKSLNAGYRYFLIHKIGSSFLLVGIITHCMYIGSIYVDDGKKRILKYQKYLFYFGLFLIVLFEISISRKPYFWFDGLPGFYSVFGLVSCVLIIIICKAIGKHWLMVKEDYYDINTATKGEGEYLD